MASKGQVEQLRCQSLVEEFQRILRHAQQFSKAFRRLRMDLRCVRIALLPINSKELTSINSQLVSCIETLEDHLERCIQVFTAYYHTSSNGPISADGVLFDDARETLEALDKAIPGIVKGLNNHHSAHSSYKIPLRYVLIYPGDFRVCRRTEWGDSRYNVLSEAEHVPIPRSNSFPGYIIYEHIDILCSGTRVYDPLFFTEDGHPFFTLGRVFSVLWDTSVEDKEDTEFLDGDPSVEEGRSRMGGFEGSWTGPYQGPTTVRSFLVFKQGDRSCLCLPISTLASQGVRMQPDQHNYGIIYSGSDCTPMTLSEEDGIMYPVLYVPAIPQREWEQPIIKGRSPPDPPYERLPTHDLLEGSRVDYRRVCEVEFGVRVKNVGLLDENSLQWLKSWSEQHQPMQQQSFPRVSSNTYYPLTAKKGMKG